MAEQTKTAYATYLPEIECTTVRPGDFDWEAVVSVKDERGWDQYMSVSKGMVSRVGEKNYLSVGVVQIDYANGRVLVELPVEADSGVRRLWAPYAAFRRGGQP
jgi:hypothetical protein